MKKVMIWVLALIWIITGGFGCINVNRKPLSNGLNKPKIMEHRWDLYSKIHQQKAEQLEKAGAYHSALYHLNIAGKLDPENTEIDGKIIDLEEKISRKARKHYQDARMFIKKGAFQKARDQLLITLRIKPDHEKALDDIKHSLTPKRYDAYTIKPGDTFSVIAQRLYRDPEKGRLIAYLNDIDSDKTPQPGTDLNILILGEKLTARPDDVTVERDDIKSEDDATAMIPATEPEKADGREIPFDADEELSLAGIQLEKGNLDQALAIAEQVLEYDYLNAEAERIINESYYRKANDMAQQERFDAALSLYKKIDPEYRDTVVLASAVENKMNQQKKATEDAEKEDLYKEAMTLVEKKKYLDSLKIFEKIDPQYKDVQQQIDSIRRFLKQKAEFHYKTGVNYYVHEDLEKAISEWEKALMYDPGHTKALRDMENAGKLLEKLEKVQ